MEHLYDAFRKAAKSKHWKKSVALFEIHLEENLHKLRDEILSGTYKPSPYNCFKVHEPKERDIMSNAFRDKVVQHVLCDFYMEPVLRNQFIYDNAASQKGKGTDFARDRLVHFLRDYYRKTGSNEGYVLQCDIHKYFPSIDHDELKKMIHPFFSDSIWHIVELIIDSTPNPGIPIGNQTSQYFAVMYLSSLDHYIKEKLHIRGYGRYMDDFYMICKTKEDAQRCLAEIQRCLPKVELNEKTHIAKISNGMTYLGFRFIPTKSGKVIVKLAKGKKQKYLATLRKQKKLLDAGEISMEAIRESFESRLEHASKGNTYYLVRSLCEYYEKLFDEEARMPKKHK